MEKLIFDNRRARYKASILRIIYILIVIFFQIFLIYLLIQLDFNSISFYEIFVIIVGETCVIACLYIFFIGMYVNTSDIYENGFLWFRYIFFKKFVPFDSIIKIEKINYMKSNDGYYMRLKIYSNRVQKPIIFDEFNTHETVLFENMKKMIEEKLPKNKIIHIDSSDRK